MTFDEMFAQAKALLENASAKDTDTAVSIQFDVSGDEMCIRDSCTYGTGGRHGIVRGRHHLAPAFRDHSH